MYIYIRSMSEAQAEIRRSIVSHSCELVKHIIKLILYADSDCVHHWQSEIYSFLNTVQKLKGKNRWPSAKFIKEALSTWNDSLDTLTWQVIEEEDELVPLSASQEKISAVVNGYQDWLATQLATKGAISPKESRAELDKLVFDSNTRRLSYGISR